MSNLQPSVLRTAICLGMIPPINLWAILIRPLTRTGRITLYAKPPYDLLEPLLDISIETLITLRLPLLTCPGSVPGWREFAPDWQRQYPVFPGSKGSLAG